MKRITTIQDQKKLLTDVNKEKEDIFSLRKKPSNNKSIQWPFKVKTNSSHKLTKKRSKKFIAKPFDPFSFKSSKQNALDETATVTREESQQNINAFVEHFLMKELKPTPTDPMDESTVDFIQEKSLDLLDKTLINMISPLKSNSNDTTLDWEFVLGNLLQLNIPPSVLDRVKRKMALITGKDTPAITAMSVAPISLSDLTITTAEEQMKVEIDYIVKKIDNYESRAEDEAFESPVKWLIDLDKKDLSSQREEIEKIHRDYTHRVLDLKPAFF